MEANECLIEGCRRRVANRGLCGGCYASARDMVAAGKVTWQDLERMGLALPRCSRRKPSAFRAAIEKKGRGES